MMPRLVLLACFGLFSAAPQMTGVIDIHAHGDPDSVPRSIDVIDLARLAKSRGMRGMVLKNHFEPTAALAFLVRKEVPGIEIFGGIVLNRPAGGLNVAAVEHMAQVKGGWGRVVWLPTFDSENQVRFSKEKRPFVPVSRDGKLLPETLEVIAAASKYRMVLATGHSSAAEDLTIVREARQRGVEHVVVTHAMLNPVAMTVAQMREAAALGAFIEFVYNGVTGVQKQYEMRDYAKAIRAVGAGSCILSSDMGQVGNPLHPDGLMAFFQGLRKEGISAADIDAMSKVNPARLLGLSF